MNPKQNPEGRSSSHTKAKILASARKLFAERGFKGTTTVAIAQHAGVNEALIFRHFPTKRDLHTAILQDRLEGEALVRLVKAAECPNLPEEEALRLVAERFLEAIDPDFLRLYYFSALEGCDMSVKFHEQFMKRFMGAIEELLRRGMAQGRFRPLDTELVAQAFIGMFRSHVLTRELFPEQSPARSHREIVDVLCELFLRGIRAV